MRALSLFFFLLVFWFFLSGYTKTFLITMGVLSAAFCTYMAYRMKIIDDEGHPIQLLFRAPMYFPWLLVEILKSTIDVAKVIINPKLPASPHMFTFKAKQKTPSGINVFANSITMTPGTFTMKIKGNDLLVHSFSKEGAEALITEDLPLNQKVVEFENAK